MKVDRIRVGAFGRLQGFDTGPESLGSLVVVLGQNEAGKSTLFTFLTTALYGFSPATRERNPHVPWGADEATGLIRLRLDERGCAEVERTLRSQPTGRLTVDGRTTELRNQALPWVGHVPRSVFRQVFAVTLSELAGLDGETWARIQEKMIGSMGAADLHSARAAAEALEREAGEIWRPNRRGNQQLRDLRAELRELRGRRAEAKDRDARIRRLVEEREHVRLELRAVREQRHLDRAEVERARSLLPIKRQLERIAALRTEGGPVEELRDLPANPSESFAELRAELAELSSEGNAITSDIAEREAVIAQAAAGAPLLERSEEILRLVARAAGSAPDRVKAIELEGEIGDVEARLDTAGRATLSESWRTVPAEALGSIATEIIRERIERSKDLAAVPSSRSKSAGLGPLVPLALGLVLLAWGVLAGRTLTSAAGAAAVAAALTWWLAVARSGRGEVDTGGRRGDLSSERALADLLRDVPVRPELIQRPDETLVVGLERLRDLARRHSELSGALESARERVARVDSDAADLATSLGHAGSGDAEAVARDLDRQLRAAERQRDAAAAAARELLRLRRSREGAAARAAELDARLGALSERAERQILHIVAVDSNCAFGDVVEARHEVTDGGFACAARSHQRRQLARANGERCILQGPLAG